MTAGLRQTPLHGCHVAAGARMMAFAGFDMPVQYTSILEEHRAVRAAAGVFDVSHMGQLRLRGSGSVDLAQALFTNDVAGLGVGQVRYGMLCRDDGGVVDDVTLYRLDDEDLLFCVNASNIERDREWMAQIAQRLGARCELRDQSDETALIAVQGPRARELCAPLLPDGTSPRRWRFSETRLAGVPVLLSRTGYTGEDGYELYTPAERAVELWEKLLDAAGPVLQPAGLGARDTLRTEMGFALYGHELDLDTHPLEAGLDRFVAFEQPFVGRDALAQARKRGPARRLVGLWVHGRAVARTGTPIHTSAGPGTVTSGTFSPSIERSIAMGYVPIGAASGGTAVEVEVRGRRIESEVTETPFYRRKG